MWSVAEPRLRRGRYSRRELRTELLGLFGIGGETADDLMLYVFSRRTFVADTYARRLFAFLGFDVPTGYLAFHKAYSPVVLDASLSVKDLQEFHGLIDEFGKAYRDDAAKSESFLGGWRLDCTANRSQ